MLYLALLSKFSRTKNQNSRISNVGCKNILFELFYAKKIETPTNLSFLQSALKNAYIGSGALAELFFLCSQGLRLPESPWTEFSISLF
jgi:hypothetical protein